VKQELLGTVVGVEARGADARLVEVQCEALEDVSAFEIVSIGLPFEHTTGLDRAVGSRLKLTCRGRSTLNAGEKVKIVINTLERGEVYRRGSGRALGSAQEAAQPVGTFAGPTDLVARTREGHPVPQDTGSQGGGQN
jgi:hypothetical protein